MPTYRMAIEYDGSQWHGWQVQPGLPTVQGAIESALSTALRSTVPITGSGRTDAGVHARGQVAHFEVDSIPDLSRLTNSLNGILPRSVSVTSIEETDPSFHARYSAIGRVYAYTILTKRSALGEDRAWMVRPTPDVDVMNGEATYLLGSHDYSSFCLSRSETRNKVCNVFRAEWHPGPIPGSWIFRIEANRFLHGMVRAIVGTLVETGQGKRTGGAVPAILKASNRADAGVAAPAGGLVLERVLYPL